MEILPKGTHLVYTQSTNMNTTFAPLIPNFADTVTAEVYLQLFDSATFSTVVVAIDQRLEDLVYGGEPIPTLLASRISRLTRRELSKLAVIVTLGNRDLIRKVADHILDPDAWMLTGELV